MGNSKNKVSLGVLIFSMAFSSCSPQISQSDSSDGKTANQLFNEAVEAAQEQQAKQHAGDINNYFLSLDSWDKLAPARADENKLKSTKSTIVAASQGAAPQTCTVEEYDLVKTPEKIVMQNPAVEILYPGALIQGEGYLQGPGGVRELPIRQRAAMSIVSDRKSVV